MNQSFSVNFFESLHKEEWREVRLGEVAELKYGKSHKNLKNGDFLAYGSGGIVRLVDSYIYSKESILIPRKGSLNNIFYANKPFWVVDTMFYTILNITQVVPKYLYYKLKITDFEILNVGSAVPSLTINTLNEILIPLPPLPIQNQIAEILSSFDDKIDLLHRQNQTLESLALTLFRHSFIENPNRNEWEKTTLENICLKIQSGGTPSTKQHSYYGGNINWYSTKELNDNFLFKSIQQITDEGLNNSSAKLFPKDSVIIAIYASPTVGRLGILTQESAFNQAACGLVVDETKSSKEFVFLFLKNERENLNLLASGSAQQNLNVEKIKNYPLLLPDKETLDYFQIQAKGFFDKIFHNTKEILNLEQMRDLVLRKIFSKIHN